MEKIKTERAFIFNNAAIITFWRIRNKKLYSKMFNELEKFERIDYNLFDNSCNIWIKRGKRVIQAKARYYEIETDYHLN